MQDDQIERLLKEKGQCFICGVFFFGEDTEE
jgi:hypothetical protein